jgi:hypothetical protein
MSEPVRYAVPYRHLIHGLGGCGIPETVTHPSTNRGGRCHAAGEVKTMLVFGIFGMLDLNLARLSFVSTTLAIEFVQRPISTTRLPETEIGVPKGGDSH